MNVRHDPDRAARPLAAVLLEAATSRLAFGLVSFALPLYAHHLGMSLAAIGLLLSTNAAVAVVLKPVMGALIDRVGVRRAHVVAVLLRTVVLVALVVATSPVHLFLARSLHGVSIAMRDPASATVLAALGGKQAVARRFAWFQTVKSVTSSGGQFLSGIVLTLATGDHRVVFAIAAVLSGLPLLVVLVGLRGALVDGLRLPQPARRTPMPRDLRRVLLPYAGLGAMMTGTAYLMSNLLPVLAVEHMGLAPAAASSLYLVKTVVGFTGPVWGWLSDRVGVRLVLGVRGLGNALSSIVWLLFPSLAGLMVGRALDDVGKAAFAPAWGATMAEVADLDPARRARTLAWLGSAENAGEMAGPVVAGAVWATFGLPALLVLRAALAVATELYALALARRAARRPSAPVGVSGSGEVGPAARLVAPTAVVDR
ncbi:MFS transporter [Intrasporangium sp.]|uniref:MFS transporter n=1 Tax=Intrasporangium sp. TaxID=1925024 RepID=UPI00322215AE